MLRESRSDRRTFEIIAQYSSDVPVFVVGTKKDRLVAYRKMEILESTKLVREKPILGRCPIFSNSVPLFIYTAYVITFRVSQQQIHIVPDRYRYLIDYPPYAP